MRQVIIIRHAIAEDRVQAHALGMRDAERPLTEKGRRRMQRAVAGLRQMVPELGLVASSSLLRAVQTAEIVASGYGDCPLVISEALAPGAGPDQLLEFLATQGGEAPIACVGHEPDLSQWVSWALCGRQQSLLQFKKGAACCLHLPQPLRAGEAELQWLLQPRQLRGLRD
jgi:phosphohistidine phosphatase